MDAATCLVILRAVDDDGKFAGEQCRHAFLRTVYSLILVEEQKGRGEDSKGKEEGEEDEDDEEGDEAATWEQCLLASHTSLLLALPDFCEAVVQLLGSLRARQPTVQFAALLTDFISRSEITSSINAHLSTRQLNAVEWMAVASLCRLGLLLPVSYESLTASAGSELASLLQLTSSQWDVEISASVRLRTESVLCFLSKACEDRSILVADCCYDALLALTLRIEAGFLASSAVVRAAVDEDGQAKTGDDSGGEDSDEEEAAALGFLPRKANQKVMPTVEAAETGGDVAQPPPPRGATVLYRSRLLEERWQDEIALPPHRTRWCDMCLTSILRIMRQCLLKTASAYPPPGKFGLSDYLGMLTSPCWQRQLLALQFIKSAITAEAFGKKAGHAGGVVPVPAPASKLAITITSERKNHLGKGEKVSISAPTTNRGEGGGGSSLKASKFQNGANRRSSNRGPEKIIEELCKNGALRPVCWLLVHKVEAIRMLARDIMQLLLDFYNEAQAAVGEGGGGTTSSVEMWASLVEQGIVPLLATILSGSSISSHVQTGSLAAVPVVDAPLAKFPEETTRLRIATLLSTLAKRTQETPSLRSRLSSALLFSGNFALRLNIFTGLVFLTGLSPSLGHSLWLLSNNQAQQKEALREISVRQSDEAEGCKSQEGLVFRLMLNNLCKEPTGLKQIILVISHVLRYAVLYKGNDDASLAEGVRAPPRSQSSLPSQLSGGGATVLVSGEGGLLTKMVCPTSASVTQRSAKLAAFLKRLEREASECLETLPGSYAVWQEVFSHTVDDYLLVTSAERMATDAIIDAYHLARRYDIQDLLVKYGGILSKRLTSDTLVATLECALGLGRDSFMAANLPLPAPSSSSDGIVAPIETVHPSSSSHGQHLIHMNLLYLCFSYMGKNTNVVFSSRFPQRAVEITLLIHQALKFVLVREVS